MAIFTRFKPSFSPKRRGWILDYVKTCLCKILDTSLTHLGIFATTLQGRCSKMLPKFSEIGFEDDRKRVQLSCYCLHSYVYLLSDQVAEICAFKGFLSAGEFSVKWRQLPHDFYVLCYSQIPRSGQQNSDRTLGFGMTRFERGCFSSRLELKP